MTDHTAGACAISYSLLHIVLVRVKQSMGLNSRRASLALDVDDPLPNSHLAL